MTTNPYTAEGWAERVDLEGTGGFAMYCCPEHVVPNSGICPEYAGITDWLPEWRRAHGVEPPASCRPASVDTFFEAGVPV